ncbi:MAG: DUF4174 domain-containing protein [Planctomycetota bacterium]
MKGTITTGLLALLLLGACQTDADTDRSARHADEAIYDLAWKHRLMVLFSPSEDDARLKRQIEIMEADKKGFADRGLVLIKAIGEEATIVFPHTEKFASGSGADLRGKLGTEPTEFAVVVVEKNVTAAHRWSKPVDAKTLFKALDEQER